MHYIHIVPIKATSREIYIALVEQDGLAKWWLPGAETTGEIGSIARSPLSSGMGEIKMKILDLVPYQKVWWEGQDHIHEEWIGTKVEFHIARSTDENLLHFTHGQWIDTQGVYGLVSYYWAALYLSRLKNMLEEKHHRALAQ